MTNKNELMNEKLDAEWFSEAYELYKQGEDLESVKGEFNDVMEDLKNVN